MVSEIKWFLWSPKLEWTTPINADLVTGPLFRLIIERLLCTTSMCIPPITFSVTRKVAD